MRTFTIKLGKRKICFSDRMIKEEEERRWWILPLIVLVYLLPRFVGDYTIYLLSLLAVNIIGAVSLDILCGFCGQLSLGHAAFLAIGAYTYGIFHMTFHQGCIISLLLAGLSGALLSLLIGIPSLRLKGLYLAIATMGFTFIVDEAVLFFSTWTHGVEGFRVSRVFDLDFVQLKSGTTDFYYFIYTLVILIVIFSRFLLHSKLGRAFTSIRDSDVAAEVSGVNLLFYKVLAFSISSFFASVGGALMGVVIGTISPEDFDILLSINYLVMLVIGGMGSVYGAVIGAIFITFLPEWITNLRDAFLPSGTDVSVLQLLIYGLIILIFIVFEPNGVYGRWLVIKAYFKKFPFNEKKIGRVAWILRWR
ncbi:MAG TPA: branched-chain amino acid ABC transporter permease [Thermococcus sp.]|nr:branched-chain amino acid ABC transporter permease [Thermococcus sp.]